MFGVQDRVNREFKCILINLFQCGMDLVRVGFQHRLQNLRLADPAVSNLHALNRIQLIAHQFLQRTLEFRIALISQMCRKAYHRGLAHAHNLTQLCGGQKYRLVIIVRNVGCQTFLPFAQLAVSIIDAVTQVICIAHASPHFCGIVIRPMFLLYQIHCVLQEIVHGTFLTCSAFSNAAYIKPTALLSSEDFSSFTGCRITLQRSLPAAPENRLPAVSYGKGRKPGCPFPSNLHKCRPFYRNTFHLPHKIFLFSDINDRCAVCLHR